MGQEMWEQGFYLFILFLVVAVQHFVESPSGLFCLWKRLSSIHLAFHSSTTYYLAPHSLATHFLYNQNSLAVFNTSFQRVLLIFLECFRAYIFLVFQSLTTFRTLLQFCVCSRLLFILHPLILQQLHSSLQLLHPPLLLLRSIFVLFFAPPL